MVQIIGFAPLLQKTGFHFFARRFRVLREKARKMSMPGGKPDAVLRQQAAISERPERDRDSESQS